MKIAVHAATCEAYQNKIDLSPNDMMLIVEQARYGMALIIAYHAVLWLWRANFFCYIS